MAWIIALAACQQRPLEKQVYIWQRVWTPEVATATRERGPRFSRLLVLGAQMGWQGATPTTVYPNLDPRVFGDRAIGLVLRIESPPLPLPVELIRDEALRLLDRAHTAGLSIAELQLDLDCPTARLAEYAAAVRSIRTRIAPVSVTFTALPDWLASPSFPALVSSADGFVLQVHSVEAPRPRTPLCDPTKALRWARKADRLGAPFRVALPTYGYLIALDASGELLGVLAEQRHDLPPATAHVETIRADAAGWSVSCGSCSRRG